ncbi:MAG: hypothetical protein ACYCVZ_00700 [Streptosporangiaceae bacterium]
MNLKSARHVSIRNSQNRSGRPKQGLVIDVKFKGILVLLAATLLAGGCAATAPRAPRHQHVAAAIPSPSPTAPAIADTAVNRGVCRNVRAWLPRAWSEDPPRVTNLLASDDAKADGSLGPELAYMVTIVVDLSPGEYMSPSTPEPVQHYCDAIGVTIRAPRVAQTAMCWHRLHKWLSGPVNGTISSLDNALSAFSKVDTSSLYEAVTFLRIAAFAATLARRWPIPACADPNGYWATFLTQEHAMGALVGTPASAASNGYIPSAAISAQQQAQSAFSSLTAELAQTTGHRPFG